MAGLGGDWKKRVACLENLKKFNFFKGFEEKMQCQKLYRQRRDFGWLAKRSRQCFRFFRQFFYQIEAKLKFLLLTKVIQNQR